VTTIVAKSQGGCREALSTKEGRSKGTTVGRRTGSEAEMRAMSVLENTKSNCHRKTHLVEPDGAGRKFMHLTRGELLRESAGAVSRGRSSEDSRRKAEGAKGRRMQQANEVQTSRVVSRYDRAPNEIWLPAFDADQVRGGTMREVPWLARCGRTARDTGQLLSNRRMRKTARPVVWKGHGAQSP